MGWFKNPSYYTIAPIELNLALGKLPLNKVHRDNFPVLKPILIPYFVRISYKHPNILKTHCIDHINEEYVQLLVKFKEIITKTTFLYAPWNFSPLLHYTTQHTDIIFGSNLVPPPWYLDYKLWVFLFILYSLRDQNRALSSIFIHAYQQMYWCKCLHLHALLPILYILLPKTCKGDSK